MNVGQLRKLLEKYPDDMDVWFSPDIGIGEGGVRLQSLKVESAFDAGLDGDEIDDEYEYIEDMDDDKIEQYLGLGYKLNSDKSVLSKDILVLHDERSL